MKGADKRKVFVGMSWEQKNPIYYIYRRSKAVNQLRSLNKKVEIKHKSVKRPTKTGHSMRSKASKNSRKL